MGYLSGLDERNDPYERSREAREKPETERVPRGVLVEGFCQGCGWRRAKCTCHPKRKAKKAA